MPHSFGSIDELGDGYGFRKVRQALGVKAFGVNAIVYPPGYEGFLHYHDEQDELYFVHSGTALFEVDGEERISAQAASATCLDDAAQGVERRRGRPRAAGRRWEGRLRRADGHLVDAEDDGPRRASFGKLAAASASFVDLTNADEARLLDARPRSSAPTASRPTRASSLSRNQSNMSTCGFCARWSHACVMYDRLLGGADAEEACRAGSSGSRTRSSRCACSRTAASAPSSAASKLPRVIAVGGAPRLPGGGASYGVSRRRCRSRGGGHMRRSPSRPPSSSPGGRRAARRTTAAVLGLLLPRGDGDPAGDLVEP